MHPRSLKPLATRHVHNISHSKDLRLFLITGQAKQYREADRHGLDFRSQGGAELAVKLSDSATCSKQKRVEMRIRLRASGDRFPVHVIVKRCSLSTVTVLALA